MIKNHDRSKYFGASDTKYVVGNWNTKTFKNWWLEKLGFTTERYDNKYTLAGTNYEHKIIDALNIPEIEKDNQFIKERIRVNLDGNTTTCIYEVKTHNAKKEFKVSKQYWRQAQVEMYASEIHKLFIVAYALKDEDYNNYFNEIDKERLQILLYNAITYIEDSMLGGKTLIDTEIADELNISCDEYECLMSADNNNNEIAERRKIQAK